MEIILRTSGHGTWMLAMMVGKSLKLGCRCVVLVFLRFVNDYKMAQTLRLFEIYSWNSSCVLFAVLSDASLRLLYIWGMYRYFSFQTQPWQSANIFWHMIGWHHATLYIHVTPTGRRLLTRSTPR